MSGAIETLRQLQLTTRSLKVSNNRHIIVRHFQRRKVFFNERRDALVALVFPTLLYLSPSATFRKFIFFTQHLPFHLSFYLLLRF